MKIIVINSVTGNDFELKVEPHQKISDIKCSIRQHQSIHTQSYWIQIMFQGRKLNNWLTIEKAGLSQGCSIIWDSRRLMRLEVFGHTSGHRLSIFTTPSCKISLLKTKIYKETLIKPFNQFLFFNGKIMKNDNYCLADYKVLYDGSVVDLFCSDKEDDVRQWYFKLQNTTEDNELDVLVKLDKVRTVKELKNCINQAHKEVDLSKKMLVFNGRVLDDEDKILSRYYLHNKSKLRLLDTDSKAGKMELKIRDRRTRSITCVNVEQSMTLGGLKEKLSDCFAIPKEVQVLYSPLKRYDDDKETLCNYHISDGCMINLGFKMIRLKVLFESQAEISVWVNPWTTVKEVRSGIYQRYHGMLPRDQETLSVEDKVLIDQKSLIDYGVLGDTQLVCKAPISFSR